MPLKRTRAERRRPRSSDAMVWIAATEAKNEFGQILERVIRGERVVIKKHGSPKAVMIPMDEYSALSNAYLVEIEALSKEFDDLLERMQTPASRAGMRAAFNATPKELGQAAAAAARKRG